MKILLVDDEEDFVATLCERLSLRGYDADWTSTGREAVKKVTDEDYDLAILDLKMPQIGGLELRMKLAKIKPKLRFLFVSGHGSVDEISAEDGNEDLFLTKPLTLEKLIETIKIIPPAADAH